MSKNIRKLLQTYYVQTFPTKGRLSIIDLIQISAGWENEMYSFNVVGEEAGKLYPEELVLRIYPGDNGRYKASREFSGMRLLYKAGYPVPQVLILESTNSPFEKPFVVMQRIDGEEMWSV